MRVLAQNYRQIVTKDATWSEHSVALAEAEAIPVSEGEPVSNGHLSAVQACLLAGAAEGRVRNFKKAKVHFDKCRKLLLATTDDPAQHFAMAKHYAAIDDFGVALELLQPLAARSPENLEILRLLGATARRSGKLPEAVAAYRKLLEREPQNPDLHKDLTRSLLANRKWSEALAAAEAWLKIAPGSAEAICQKTIALNEVSGRAAVADLLNFDKFVSVAKLEPPEGYGSAATFNMSLETAVFADTNLSAHKTRGGFRVSDELFGTEAGPLYELEQLICDHVDAYYDRLDKRRKNPFVRTIPDTYMLDGWARVYEGPAEPVPEIHGEAHLCGYYYIRVPGSGEVNSSSASLTLGPAPADMGGKRRLPSLNVWPDEGSIALFPAYMHTQTKPAMARQRMICIAFSVMPV